MILIKVNEVWFQHIVCVMQVKRLISTVTVAVVNAVTEHCLLTVQISAVFASVQLKKAAEFSAVTDSG